ncbi:hypothetical protein DKX38_007103 [Salix brachista]|uniref:Pectinesterase catalytic domain-containing protein n=1 Tax=Salix brachista TaxID=2182728 RepID=A0A5N5MM87_9ROSI|nr:hypothetical protein DKX38_007103 [Salix brachista]
MKIHNYWCCTIEHIYREQNEAADALAIKSYNLDFGLHVYDEAPDFLKDILVADARGALRSRSLDVLGQGFVDLNITFRNTAGAIKHQAVASFIGSLIDPAGWSAWSRDFALSTLYYTEFNNTGPGSNTTSRVKWPGYHVINGTYRD